MSGTGKFHEQLEAWKIFCFLLDRGADRECVDKFGNRPPNIDMFVDMYEAQKLKAEMFADIVDPLKKSSRPDFYSPPEN